MDEKAKIYNIISKDIFGISTKKMCCYLLGKIKRTKEHVIGSGHKDIIGGTRKTYKKGEQ
jgi:hypothetical protein